MAWAPGGAGGGQGNIGTLGFEADGDVARGQVGNHLGTRKGEPGAPLRPRVSGPILPGADPAHATGNDHPGPIRVFHLQVETRVMHRLHAGGQGKLGKRSVYLICFKVFLGDFFFLAGLQNFLSDSKFSIAPPNDGKILRNAVALYEFGIKAVQASYPDSPASNRFHTVGTSSPRTSTIPTPVITTRRIPMVFVNDM